MCKLLICEKCKKFTWAGCGQHLANLFKDKTINEICQDDKAKFDIMKKYIKKD